MKAFGGGTQILISGGADIHFLCLGPAFGGVSKDIGDGRKLQKMEQRENWKSGAKKLEQEQNQINTKK